jgi:hypothetical protein
MGKKNHKKAIQSLEKRIVEHQNKIQLKLLKENPDQGLIKHWQIEIKAFETGIQRALKRLGKL